MATPAPKHDYEHTLDTDAALTQEQRDDFLKSLAATEDSQPVRFWKARAERGLDELNGTLKKYRATTRFGTSYAFHDFTKRLDAQEKEDFLSSFNNPAIRAEMERAIGLRPGATRAAIAIVPASAAAGLTAGAVTQSPREFELNPGLGLAITMFVAATTMVITGMFAADRQLKAELGGEANEGSRGFFRI